MKEKTAAKTNGANPLKMNAQTPKPKRLTEGAKKEKEKSTGDIKGAVKTSRPAANRKSEIAGPTRKSDLNAPATSRK